MIPSISSQLSTPEPAGALNTFKNKPHVANLTMDALLSYCQSRLRTLDDQVKGIFNQQSRVSENLKAIGALNYRLTNGLNNGGFKNSGSYAHETIREFQNAIAAVGGPETPLGKQLTTMMDAFIAKVGTNGGKELRAEMAQPDFATKEFGADADKTGVAGCSVDDVKNFMQQLKDVQQDLNNGSELQMITLQSLMSQRQMAVQLVTNLVQSLGEQTNKVVANIGR